jgi:hypothetical protein
MSKGKSIKAIDDVKAAVNSTTWNTTPWGNIGAIFHTQILLCIISGPLALLKKNGNCSGTRSSS